MRFALAACLMLAVVALAAPARAQRTGTIISAVDAILNQYANLDQTIQALLQRPYRAERG